MSGHGVFLGLNSRHGSDWARTIVILCDVPGGKKLVLNLWVALRNIGTRFFSRSELATWVGLGSNISHPMWRPRWKKIGAKSLGWLDKYWNKVFLGSNLQHEPDWAHPFDNEHLYYQFMEG